MRIAPSITQKIAKGLLFAACASLFLLLNDGRGYNCSQMNEALDSKDVAIICDQDAEYMYKYVHHAKKIVCTDYPAVLEDSVVQIFNEMLVA